MLGQSQAQDHLVANPPTDSVSSLVLNGSLNSPPTMLIATSWDCSVRSFILFLYIYILSLLIFLSIIG